MSHHEKEVLKKFAKFILTEGLKINGHVSTLNYDYEIITFVDEVQILDDEDKIIISVYKDDVKNE